MMNPSMKLATVGGPELPDPLSQESGVERKSLLGRLTDISNNTKKVVEACYTTTKAQIRSGTEMLRADIEDGVERTVKSAEDKYLIANQAFQNVQIKTVDGIRAGVQGATEQAKKLAGSSKEEGVDFISYTAEKFRDVTKKYKELPPKTKFAIGISLTAGSLVTGAFAGPAVLASTFAVMTVAQRGLGAISTFIGLAEKLESIYAQEEAAGNKVSTGRKALGIGGSALISAFIGSGEFAKVAGEGLKTATSFVGEKMEALGVNAAVSQSINAIKEKVAMLKMPQFGTGEALAGTLPQPKAPFSENDVDGWGLSDTKRVDEVEMRGLTDAPSRGDNPQAAPRVVSVPTPAAVQPPAPAMPAAMPVPETKLPDIDDIHPGLKVETPAEKIVPTVAIAGNESYAPGDRQTIYDDTIDPNVKQGEVSKPSAGVATAPIISDDVINDVVKKKEAEWDAAKYNDLTEANDRDWNKPPQVSVALVDAPLTPPAASLASSEPIQFNSSNIQRTPIAPIAPVVEPTVPVPTVAAPNVTIVAAPAQVTTPSAVGSTVAGATVGGTPVQADSVTGTVTLGQPSGVAPAPTTPPKIKVEDLTNFTKPQSGISETVASAVRPSTPGAINPIAMAEAAKLVSTEAVKGRIREALQSVFLKSGLEGSGVGANMQLAEDITNVTKYIQTYVGQHPTMTVEALLLQKDGSPEFKTLQKAITEIINKGDYGRDQLTTLKGKTLLDFFKR